MNWTAFEVNNTNLYFTWIYPSPSKASVRLRLTSLAINRTFHFQVALSQRAFGSLIVHVRDIDQPTIISGFVSSDRSDR